MVHCFKYILIFYRYALTSLLERLLLRIMKLLKTKFHKRQIYTTPNIDYTSSQITNLPPNKNKLLEVSLVSQKSL